jgi:uncharacterized SAM-binding protein YcdF (DUF218 family)
MTLSFLFLVLFFNIAFCTSTKHDVVLVLGSSDERILNERIDSVIQYINSITSPIIVYISGGIKHPSLHEQTEAYKISSRIIEKQFEHVTIVIDEYAQNTAENFTFFKYWISEYFSYNEIPEVIITTSDFHQNRALILFQNIVDNITPKWNLSKSTCIQCWADETIHIKNVHSDINKARLITYPI